MLLERRGSASARPAANRARGRPRAPRGAWRRPARSPRPGARARRAAPSTARPRSPRREPGATCPRAASRSRTRSITQGWILGRPSRSPAPCSRCEQVHRCLPAGTALPRVGRSLQCRPLGILLSSTPFHPSARLVTLTLLALAGALVPRGSDAAPPAAAGPVVHAQRARRPSSSTGGSTSRRGPLRPWPRASSSATPTRARRPARRRSCASCSTTAPSTSARGCTTTRPT